MVARDERFKRLLGLVERIVSQQLDVVRHHSLIHGRQKRKGNNCFCQRQSSVVSCLPLNGHQMGISHTRSLRSQPYGKLVIGTEVLIQPS